MYFYLYHRSKRIPVATEKIAQGGENKKLIRRA